MKINFSKKEYRILLDMLYLSDWMMTSHEEEPKNLHQEHQALRKKLLSYYKEMNAEDVIEYSKELDGYFELAGYDEYIHEKFIDPYNYDVFWDELIDALARRDIINSMGIEKYKAMGYVERATKAQEIKAQYANEFEQHGVEHLKIHRDGVITN